MSGLQEYRLYSFLATRFSNTTIIDIGTYKGSSAIALAHNPSNRVVSYNLVDDIQAPAHRVYDMANVEFRIANVLDDLTAESVSKVRLIVLDIDHLGNAEQRILDRLRQVGYIGLIVLDDIHHPMHSQRAAMEALWSRIPEEKHDVTRFGHATGTGIVVMRGSRVKGGAGGGGA